MTPHQLRRTLHLLRAGGVIAYPTEAVYGLGCDPDDARAVHRILALKRRPVAKGLILIAAEFEQLQPYLLALEPAVLAQVRTPGPDPITWLLPARSEVPYWLCGAHDTLAVRVTDHPLSAELCRAFGKPLVSTSANRAGRPPARTALRVRRQLGKGVDRIVVGRLGGALRPSAIHDPFSGRVVRVA